MKQHRQFFTHSAAIIALTLTLLFSSNITFAINKCTTNEQVSYTDLPCPEPAHSSEFTRQIIPPNDPAAAKKRHLANQKKLHQVNQQKAKEEKRYKREIKALARHIREDKNHEYRCKELDLKRKAAREHQFGSHIKRRNFSAEKARLRAQQAENKYRHVCKS